jgi:hypothetical protein
MRFHLEMEYLMPGLGRAGDVTDALTLPSSGKQASRIVKTANERFGRLVNNHEAHAGQR